MAMERIMLAKLLNKNPKFNEELIALNSAFVTYLMKLILVSVTHF